MAECRTIIFFLVFLFISALLITVNIDILESDEDPFLRFVRDYNRKYLDDKDEFNARHEYFQRSMKRSKHWNSMKKTPNSASYGTTEFSDMSALEFTATYLRSHSHTRNHNHNHSHSYHNHRFQHNHTIFRRDISVKSLPPSVDWRKLNVVNGVETQGLCGACWAFSAIGTIESMAAIKTGVLPKLSVQQVIDCAKNGNEGCSGGDPCALVEWLESNNIGIEAERNYPLLRKTSTCQIKSASTGVHIDNFACYFLQDNEKILLQLLAEHGPVAAAVNALSWQNYVGGVIDSHCPGQIRDLNHAVEVVGYDMTYIPPYYIVRNSWGSSFGEKGYVRVAIGNNTCGIADEITALDVM